VRCYDRSEDPHLRVFFQKHKDHPERRKIKLHGEVSCAGVSYQYSRFGVINRGMPLGDTEYRATARFDSQGRNTSPRPRPRTHHLGVPASDPSKLSLSRSHKLQVDSILSAAALQHTHNSIRNVEIMSGLHPDTIQTTLSIPAGPADLAVDPTDPASVAHAVYLAKSRSPSRCQLLCNGTVRRYDSASKHAYPLLAQDSARTGQLVDRSVGSIQNHLYASNTVPMAQHVLPTVPIQTNVAAPVFPAGVAKGHLPDLRKHPRRSKTALK